MKKRGKSLLILIICGLILAAGGFIAFWGYQKAIFYQQKQNDLDRLSADSYQGAFFSMYDISTYPVENFTKYFGIKIEKADYCVRTIDEINDYLEAILASENEVKNVYIGLEPYLLWKSSQKDISAVHKGFDETFYILADEHPEISFEVFLSYPSVQYWLSLSEKEREISFTLYRQFVQILDGRDNISIFYMGGEEWIIQNPENYIDSFTTTEDYSNTMFLLHLDSKYKINSGNVDAMIGRTESIVNKNIENPPQYPDLSGWDIVFFGDSIIGNYSGALSIPGVISGFTHASTFNCGQGGTGASGSMTDGMCFPAVAKDFINGETVHSETNFAQGMEQYYSDAHEGKRTCFIIHYGANDYFSGAAIENKENPYDTHTYAGALRMGILKLKEKYPDALYIVMGPGKTGIFDNGTEPHGDEGNRLVDYYNAADSVAEEMEIAYIDLYNEFPNEENELADVLVDSVHYNEYGRYLVGVKIIDFFREMLI